MMKKIILFIVILIATATTVIVIKSKFNTNQIEYKIADIECFKYVKYKENEKYGVIDREGNIILNAEYENIDIPNPEKDVFICYNDENSVALNSKKEKLFEKYENVETIKLKNIASILCFEKTVLKYEQDGLWGLITMDGKKITSNIYKSIENLPSTEGKLIVSKDEKIGVINISGKLLVDIKYDRIYTDNYYDENNKYVEAGFIVSNTTDDGYRYGYVAYNGDLYLKPEFNSINRITALKEVYLVVAKNGQYGLYKEGKKLIDHKYQSINYLDNGGIIIEKNAQYGIATLNGETKVEPKYSKIEDNGIYMYASNESQNDVYSVDGQKLDVSFNKYIYETDNREYRIISVLNNDVNYYGIEKNNGEKTVKPSYSYIEYGFEDYFIAENEKGQFGVINGKGETIIDFKYDVVQKVKNKNILQAIKNDSKEMEIYSSTIVPTIKMTNATLKNKRNYVVIKNEKETIYLDSNGNKIEEKSDIIKKDMQRELPSKINDYTKVQSSLDDVYYSKEIK